MASALPGRTSWSRFTPRGDLLGGLTTGGSRKSSSETSPQASWWGLGARPSGRCPAPKPLEFGLPGACEAFAGGGGGPTGTGGTAQADRCCGAAGGFSCGGGRREGGRPWDAEFGPSASRSSKSSSSEFSFWSAQDLPRSLCGFRLGLVEPIFGLAAAFDPSLSWRLGMTNVVGAICGDFAAPSPGEPP